MHGQTARRPGRTARTARTAERTARTAERTARTEFAARVTSLRAGAGPYGERQLHLRGREPVLTARVEACPVDVCFAEDQVPGEWQHFIALNAAFYRRQSS